MNGLKSLFFLCCLIAVGCHDEPKQERAFDPETVKPVIEELHKKWSEGTKDSDINILSSVYDEHGHYLPNQENLKHGNKEITAYWQQSLPFVKDIKLDMESLEGTKDILYETGKGYALLRNGEDAARLDTFHFKYVNVWRLQADGSYKCVIDTFNDLPPVK